MSIDSLNLGTQINGIGGGITSPTKPDISASTEGASFKEALQKADKVTSQPELSKDIPALKFSSHAVERMQSRGIRLGPDQMEKIHSAVDKARDKGAKETLILANEAALIVSVKNNTVVTVMDSNNMKENVFTNIDSTVMI